MTQSDAGLVSSPPGRRRAVRAELAADWPQFDHPRPVPRLAVSEARPRPDYGISQLRDDLERSVFLLGGSDREPCSAHDGALPASRPRTNR